MANTNLSKVMLVEQRESGMILTYQVGKSICIEKYYSKTQFCQI
jgi:hypothetical protein